MLAWGCRMALALPVLRGRVLRQARRLCKMDLKATCAAVVSAGVPVSQALLSAVEAEDGEVPERVAEVLRPVLEAGLKPLSR